MKGSHRGFALVLLVMTWSVAHSSAYAAKVWDPHTAIDFVMAGTDDPIAPSDVGDNGLITRDFVIIRYRDVDHWIDPDESVPGNEGWPDEDLPQGDIDYYTDAPSPGGLEAMEGAFRYTAPSIAGDFVVKLTGTDRSQTIAPGEGGTRHDQDNTDNWWDQDWE